MNRKKCKKRQIEQKKVQKSLEKVQNCIIFAVAKGKNKSPNELNT